MGEMMSQFEKMEQEIITTVLKKEYPELSDLWKDRYFVKEREWTGVGFFSHFSNCEKKANESETLFPPSENRTISIPIGATLNKKISVGFVLFFENGNLDCLEGYTYGDESWPENIESYEIFSE
ncbi:MAG: hypothetical protein LBQ80_04855 [Clostridium sp.]|nr:hypothetical protein [Clostridium sp.]